MVGSAAATVWVSIESAPESPILSVAPVEPVVIAPVESNNSLAEPANVLLRWSDPTELLWSGAEGLITSVNLAKGDEVASGQLVATVNGSGVIALTTKQPMYRDLALDDTGPDVTYLASALQELGLLSESASSNLFNADIATAVRRLNMSRGVDSAVFSAMHTMWLPANFTVDTTMLKVGTLSPGLGSVAITGVAELTDAYVTVAESDGPSNNRPFRFNDRHERKVEVEESVYRLSEDGSIRDLQRLALSANREVERIEGAVVELVTPLTTYRIPSSAVLSSSGGGFCVVDEAGSTTPIEIVDAGAGSVQVAQRLPELIVVNPLRSGVATKCN